MEQRRDAANPISSVVAAGDHAASRAASQATSQAEETPLRRYFATLDQSDEGQQLFRQIRLFARKADLVGELSAHEVALEILQEVVVEALRAEARFDVTRSPTPWLLSIAANVIKRRREKLFRQRKNETPASDLSISPSSATGESMGELTEEDLFDYLVKHARSSPEQEVLAAQRLDEMLGGMVPEERHLIELYVFHDMKANEVARALGITPVNARVRFHRALKKLRAELLARSWPRGEAKR